MAESPVVEILRREVEAGLPRLGGGRGAFSLPLRQSLIDEVLRALPQVPEGFSVQVGGDGRLVVRHGVFHANVLLHPTARLTPQPVVVLELASTIVAWGLSRAPLPPFVRVAGRQIEIALAAIPALRDLAPLWPHVEDLAFTTEPGRLDVHVALAVRGS